MWTPTEEEKYGVVICSFRGSVPQGLVLEIGETVQILEKCEGWYRGVSTKKPNVKGIFPANYIHLKKAIVSNRGQYETVVPLEDSIVTEVTATLQEWASLWKQLYVKHKVDLFYKLRHVMNELIDLRRQLLSGHLTQDQVREVKRHITVRLDWGNEHLGLDLVPRKDFEVVDSDQISVSDLYKMHLSSRQSVQQSTSQVDTMRPRHGEACRMPVPHHFFLSLKSFTYNTIGEDTDVFFSLYDMREGKQISERFLVRLNKNGGPRNPEKIERMCALFTDLSSKDMKRDLYIVAHVIRIGRMLLNDSKKGPAHLHYRRPYGCAVLSILDVLQSLTELKEEKDFVLKVYTCNNESEWSQIHENIIRKSSAKYSAPSASHGLIISLQLLRGDMEQIRRENPMIFNRGLAITRKLGFPDVIMPGRQYFLGLARAGQTELIVTTLLYITYLELFVSWEFGIPLCRELACQYESLYDYQSLSWIRKMEASYYDNIMEQQRLEPEFFRVGFYGRKFPFFLRNKEYVCRGHDYERLEAFQQRMLSEFPQAVAMQHPNHPDDAILQCDAQYLQIYAVTPIPDYVDVLQMDRVPDRVKSFYRVNNVRKFRYDRPFHKGPKDKENEFKSLWIERTTLTLTHSLPGISRWFEVERRELVEVSPLENAIQVVENKNQELRALISQYQHKQVHGNINLLSMCLNGVIDAAVNGGIARYQEAFFDKDYITKHPGDAEKITQLKELMQEQVHVLGVGLAVHEKFVHPEMRPLHKKLIDQFQMMRASLYHEFPGLDKLSPACSGTSTPRGNVLASHSPMSPENIKMTHRHSPMNLMGTGRHSSSSLSSHASSEAGNVVMLGDSSMGEAPEDLYHHMQLAYPNPRYQGSVTNVSVLSSSQASPSSSSLSSTHSAPSQMITSAPSSARGSPSLPDKYRHAREMMLLLPTHRDRPSSAMYPAAILENGQLPNFQRALFQQVVGSCKPCSDPNLSVAEKGHYSLHFDAFHHPLGDTPPALPARTLRKSPLHPIPASPTSPQSGLDGSNSTLSGSASSGVSSLSESNFGHSSEAPPRTDTMDSMPSQAWNADEDLEPPYLPVHYSLSESAVLDSIKAQPCRSHSAPGCVIPQDPMDPPALPPKPYHTRLPALEHDEGVLLREDADRPRGLHRKASLPPGSAKEEQARMAWEHGRGEQ
ncbi:dedicator of cytokinesis protein 3 isoform X13 [Canis lupus familiaris]|uniref:dedicator of cytokinesis protein 3 isoform X13 n=1 Tax=Canis lupus familiaris TaxID=9615 RepID=UPI0018F61C72|nr:dedicator of cytokinesis protein 3 isoform X13 [Canis lupus familiaris]